MKPFNSAGRKIKAVVTVWEQHVAPRFDQTTEAVVASIEDGRVTQTRTVILAHASSEDLCQLIISEQADVVVAGGVQRRYYEYLTWKKVVVVDSVMGLYKDALELLARGELSPEAMLYNKEA